jgi:hypothetical protein
MTFTNYALVYEKDGRFFGSMTNVPTAEDTDLKLTRRQVEGYKLVYATNNEIRGSMSGIPSETDTIIWPVATENTVETNEPTEPETPAAEEDEGEDVTENTEEE